MHFITDINTLLVSDMLLNNIVSPVKWSGTVCLHLKMVTRFRREFNMFQFPRSVSVFKRKFEASTDSLVNWLKWFRKQFVRTWLCAQCFNMQLRQYKFDSKSVKHYKTKYLWLASSKKLCATKSFKNRESEICEVSDTPNYTEFAVNTRNVVPYVVDRHRLIN